MDMTDAEAEAVVKLEKDLVEWFKDQNATASASIIAIGIAAARLIHGVGEISGGDAAVSAARLLDNSVASALVLFQAKGEVILH